MANPPLIDPRPTDALGAAMASCVLAGLAVARLTLGLNPHLREDASDTVLLCVYFALAYGAAGLGVGGLGAALLALTRRCVDRPDPRRRLGVGTVAILFGVPLVYAALLPDLGLGVHVLTHWIFAPWAVRALELGLVLTALAASGWGLAAVFGTRIRTFVAGIWILGLVSLLLVEPSVRPGDAAAAPALTPAAELPPPPAVLPPRVVLLCVDGADLEVIEPMVAAGELPAFARLMREGTWGILGTFEPTISPALWTTLITGKSPEEHGIHQFLHFRLPGIRQAIYEFPLHTGLNFQVFPRLERVPGMPRIRRHYTSNMRRAAALWNIVGQRYRVGAFRWLVTWPAEEVNGFNLAGGFGWVQFNDEGVVSGEPARKRAVHPRDLLRKPGMTRRHEVTPEDLAAFVGPGYEIDAGDPRLRPVRVALADATADQLGGLIEAFDVRFAAAAFYSVDPFHHLFNDARDQGGPFADAIAQSYRLADARLAQLLERLDETTHVIVVSDHGFDFAGNHHTYAPPGVFLARGPAFGAGRRVDELSLYDIAPLVLHLLDMPLPEDMPGTRTGRYRSALSDAFLATHPVARIATWEGGRAVDHQSLENPKEEEIRDVLESLGYVR